MLNFTVNTLLNENDGVDTGNVSLTEAIEAANASPGQDLINFEDSLSGGTVDIGGSLNITDELIITGLGKDNLRVDGTLNLSENTNNLTISGLSAEAFIAQDNSEINVNLEEVRGRVATINNNSASIDINRSDLSEISTQEAETTSLTVNESTVSGNISFISRNVDAIINDSIINKGGIGMYGFDDFNLKVNNSIISGGERSGILSRSGRSDNIEVNNSTISNHPINGVDLGTYDIYTPGKDGNVKIQNTNIIENGNHGIFIGPQSRVNVNKSTMRLNITNSTIANNGNSGIFNNLGNIKVINSTISGNENVGIYNNPDFEPTQQSSLFIGAGVANSTITDNEIGVINGVELFYERFEGESTTFAVNSIISGNRTFDVINDFRESLQFPDDVQAEGQFISEGNNIIGTGNGISDFNQPTDQITTDPKLNLLADNGGLTLTHLPQMNSPAINAGNQEKLPPDVNDLDGDGNTTEPIPFDQRGIGFDRVVGPQLDIGAVEVQPIPEPNQIMGTLTLFLVMLSFMVFRKVSNNSVNLIRKTAITRD